MAGYMSSLTLRVSECISAFRGLPRYTEMKEPCLAQCRKKEGRFRNGMQRGTDALRKVRCDCDKLGASQGGGL